MSNGVLLAFAHGLSAAQKITDAGRSSPRLSLVAPFQIKPSHNRSILLENVSGLIWIRYPTIETGPCCAPVNADQPGPVPSNAIWSFPLCLVQSVRSLEVVEDLT